MRTVSHQPLKSEGAKEQLETNLALKNDLEISFHIF